MVISHGFERLVLDKAVDGVSLSSQAFSITGDSCIVSVWVDSISAGQHLEVSVYEQLTDDKERLLYTFSTLTAASTSFEKYQSPSTNARLRIAANTDTVGSCTFQVYVRALASGGSVSIANSGLLLPAIVTFISTLTLQGDATITVVDDAAFQIVSGMGNETVMGSSSDVTIS